MPQNEDGKGQGSRGLIIIAVIGLIGTLGAALISNWDKFFNPKQPVTIEALTVPADSPKGIFWENKENSDVNVSFEATGRWRVIPEDWDDPKVPIHARGYLPPGGDPNYSNRNDTVCQFPTGALVVVDEQGNCKQAYGAKGSFDVESGETVFFKVNDLPDPRTYNDNIGQVDVRLSVLKK